MTNWRRGLFRCWVFGSPIWALLIFWQFAKANWPSANALPSWPADPAAYLVLAWAGLGIPIIVLLIGLGFFWAFDGFKPDEDSD